ncbi:Fur family transcriptional regulator [Promethearchaeum syntrophicum]|uniref:Fur family transcriptional regulator n=1 Tax=Promethearchaeum syntrophicum TaxID=2594042 RepID=A0A5B9DGB2_9ARCH|nr:Fur family transcriptional regulator [Candidatus Prometheoarchaeum syntrophicum]
MENQHIIDLLKKNNLKVTTQRLLVTKYILSRFDHPSADQIYHDLHDKFPTISLGTIYKTLNSLKEIGVVNELGFGEGAVRYDPNTKIHINLVCTKCNSILDYYPDQIQNSWNNLIKNLHVKPIGQRIDIYYKCKECQNRDL